MTRIRISHLLFLYMIAAGCRTAFDTKPITDQDLQKIHGEVSTPYKFGVVMEQPDPARLIDSPSIFYWNGAWCMAYIIFDGKGYETWLAKSDDLLHWTTQGRILSFTRDGWDATQKAGYIALLNTEWGKPPVPVSFQGNYWLSYLGGNVEGYEAGRLGVGMAYTKDPSQPKEWTRMPAPVLSANDMDARWFEHGTIFKSSIIRDDRKHTGHPFVMYYNARGDTAEYESIGMAVSDDMQHWTRFGDEPVVSQRKNGTISGDAQIVKIEGLYVMFYFGAFWNGSKNAVERFAVSRDLIHWREWEGEDLVKPSETYDGTYAHKPCVLKWKGTVYHFYTAVGDHGRVIALATSKPLKNP